MWPNLKIQVISIFFLACVSVRVNSEENTINNVESASSTYADINSKSRATEIFNQVLQGSYDPKVRPTGVNGSGPVEVSVNLFLLNVENIDDIKMEYTMQLIFYQQWIDPRVKYEHLEKNVKYLQLTKPDRIWVPDVFFVNEKSSSLHELILPNLFTRVYPDGRVLQVYRITLLLSCPMNLKYYPLDKQSCPMRMESYGWSTDDLILKWRTQLDSQGNAF